MITVDVNRLVPADPGRTSNFRILDIGCGSGRHTGEAARFPNAVAVGSDRNFSDVAETKKRLWLHEQMGECMGRWETLVSDITRLPFKNAYFDAVICSEVLEHIPDHERAISETIRVLKPGGTLAVSVPRYFPERICWALSRQYRNTEGGHVRIYRTGQLIKLLEAHGLKKLAIHHAHALHAPYWWLKCLVGPDRKDSIAVNLYHRFLVWDMMKRPPSIRFLDRLLNPVMGKSVVIYAM